ncbi:MAG: thiamine diphosphokinase [Clostridiales bacterium]|nr:thiamine diphosphokinase [Clostridiales bacterium]
MNTLIIAGGSLDDEFALRCCRAENFNYMIAADAGLGFFYRNGLMPDLIVGDFDSADTDILNHFIAEDTCRITPELIRLNPIKDDTDSEHAVREAIKRGATDITMLGATSGKRIDHLLGNIALLGIGLESKVPITLLDPNNRIRMYGSYGNLGELPASEGFEPETSRNIIRIPRSRQHGSFLSLVPYSGRVTGVTMTGVKYPLSDYTMDPFSSLGISNEITDDEACISFNNGVLLVIESSDA